MSDRAALEHSVLFRKETVVAAAGNTNSSSQDGCVLNLQIARTQGLFRVLTDYFWFLCTLPPKVRWGRCKVPGPHQWCEDSQMSESAHNFWCQNMWAGSAQSTARGTAIFVDSRLQIKTLSTDFSEWSHFFMEQLPCQQCECASSSKFSFVDVLL